MTISHNVMIRGYNSIYQQAPRLSPTDHKDFIAYSLAWHRYVHDHHQYEERLLFPSIEEATGEKGIMDGQAEQHGKPRTSTSGAAIVYMPKRKTPSCNSMLSFS